MVLLIARSYLKTFNQSALQEIKDIFASYRIVVLNPQYTIATMNRDKTTGIEGLSI